MNMQWIWIIHFTLYVCQNLFVNSEWLIIFSFCSTKKLLCLILIVVSFRSNFQCSQLHINLQALVDEREELLQERDTYKFKVHRLNYEISGLLKAKNNNIDIDALITENK